MHIVLAGPNASGIDERIMILKIDTNFPIASASVVYPYIAMITQNGRLILYKVEYTPHLALNRVCTSSPSVFHTTLSIRFPHNSLYPFRFRLTTQSRDRLKKAHSRP